MTLRFTPDDHARVANAITQAERGTSGEIYAVFARASDDYAFVAATVALLLSTVTALLVSLLAFALDLPVPALALEGAQIAGALLVFGALRAFPRLRMLFVPRGVARRRASRFAAAQFLAHNLHATATRTGVLVFVSEAEHHAEIIADEGIARLVDQAEWDGAVAALTRAAGGDRLAEGYVEAIGRVGALLAGAFPPEAGDRNEIPDRLVEI